MKNKPHELSRRQMLAAVAISSLGSVAKGSTPDQTNIASHFLDSGIGETVRIEAKPATIAIDRFNH